MCLVFIIFDYGPYDKNMNTYRFNYVLVMVIPSLFGRITVLMQAYEWITMVYIIATQKSKSQGEIMYEINNSYKSFQNREIKFKWFYFTLLCLFFALDLYKTSKFPLPNERN